MRKVLLFLLFLMIFIFPKSEVFAADKCQKTTASLCSDGGRPGAGGCTGSGGAPSLPVQKTLWACDAFPGTGPSTQDDTCECRPGLTNPTTTTPAVTTSAPCSGSSCTSGKGQICSDGIISGSGVKTAIGCVPTEPKALVEGILKFGTLAAGGVAFLLMILGALQMITAEGNPENIKHGQERFYSAIIGLLLIIFAVLLMQVIGVDLLGLPGFGSAG